MSPLTYPDVIETGTEVDAAEIQGMFNAIKDFVDALEGAGSEDTSWRTILTVGIGEWGPDAAAGTWVWRDSGAGFASTTALDAGGIPVIYLDDADYTLSGETPTLSIRGQLYTNATDPSTGSFTFGLHEITASGGGVDVLTLTVNNTAVAGSTAAQADPAASTPYSVVSAAFSFPADGRYTIGIATSATIANNAAVGAGAQLQVKVAS